MAIGQLKHSRYLLFSQFTKHFDSENSAKMLIFYHMNDWDVLQQASIEQ